MESGDVITYRRGNMVVTHRIVEKSEEGYCTKGDANAEEDAGIVLEKQVIGNVIVALPWLGFGIVWLRQRGTLFSGRGAVMLLQSGSFGTVEKSCRKTSYKKN